MLSHRGSSEINGSINGRYILYGEIGTGKTVWLNQLKTQEIVEVVSSLKKKKLLMVYQKMRGNIDLSVEAFIRIKDILVNYYKYQDNTDVIETYTLVLFYLAEHYFKERKEYIYALFTTRKQLMYC